MLRAPSELFAQAQLACQWEGSETAVPGLTYEQGVASALLWALGYSEEIPIIVNGPEGAYARG